MADMDPLAAPEAGDEHFNYVSRAHGFGCGSSVKIKGDLDEAAKEHHLKAVERFHSSVAATNKEAINKQLNNEAIAIVATAAAATITTCGCLAIWKMAGRRAPTMRSPVCCLFLSCYEPG
jgi:hypothetical protein